MDPQYLIHLVSEIGEYQMPVKKDCVSLSHRVRLLAPLVEEIWELNGNILERCFLLLRSPLQDAKELLQFCHEGSKIYLAMERTLIASKFVSITTQLDQALDALLYNELEISDEVREQVELVHAQLKRGAKGSTNSLDMKLCKDLAMALSEDRGGGADMQAALERVAEKLQLKSQPELSQESRALKTVFVNECGKSAKSLEGMSLLLRRLEELSVKKNRGTDTHNPVDSSALVGSDTDTQSYLEIPDDYKCPISLELMKDPVIVATGQTYERLCIHKWLDAGNRTCPKTQQVLDHLMLTPNYAIRSLIQQWCQAHGVEQPKKQGLSKLRVPTAPPLPSLVIDPNPVDALVWKLQWGELEARRVAAEELRHLAKRSGEYRTYIAEAGAIPLLVGLLSSPDPCMQAHAVTALLNLSIHDGNRGAIVGAGAVGPIVSVLRFGAMEARENAAAALFSLSVLDANKTVIGNSSTGAIPALAQLLREGSLRGKKDAATALFNLCIYRGNRAQVVRTGVVLPLLRLLRNPAAEMVDESLALLAILATHADGRAAIGNACPPVVGLLDLIRQPGSPRNKENAVSILLALCQHGSGRILVTLRSGGAFRVISDLAQTGTSRARRKATALLDLLTNHYKVQPELLTNTFV